MNRAVVLAIAATFMLTSFAAPAHAGGTSTGTTETFDLPPVDVPAAGYEATINVLGHELTPSVDTPYVHVDGIVEVAAQRTTDGSTQFLYWTPVASNTTAPKCSKEGQGQKPYVFVQLKSPDGDYDVHVTVSGTTNIPELDTLGDDPADGLFKISIGAADNTTGGTTEVLKYCHKLK